MPRKYQQGYIFRFKGSKGKTGKVKPPSYLLVSKKTGFVDVWINGTHIYYDYDEKEQYNSVSDIDMKSAFDPDRRTTTKKQKIVVKKKSK